MKLLKQGSTQKLWNIILLLIELFLLPRDQINSREEAQLIIKKRFLGWIEKHSPRISHELEGRIDIVEFILIRIEEESQPTLLPFDELKVVRKTLNLEDGIPIRVVVDPLIGGEKEIGDGQDLIWSVQQGFGFLS